MRKTGLLSLVFLTQAVGATQTAMLCDRPLGVVYSDEPAVVRLVKDVSADGLKWRLTDWYGKDVATGEWPADGALRLEPLPSGYYFLSGFYDATNRLRDTSLAVLDRLEKPISEDSIFAIVTSFSNTARTQKKGVWERGDYPWYDWNARKAHVDAVERLGMPVAREMVQWKYSQPKATDSPLPSPNEQDADRLLRGIGVRQCVQNSHVPAWSDAPEGIARNLLAHYEHYRTLADYYGDAAIAFEHFNEPDLRHVPAPAWDYAASMKAAYLGFKAGNGNVAVLNGAFCKEPESDYTQMVLKNDLLEFSDVYNYHCYSDLVMLPEKLARIRKNVVDYGHPDRAIWITEFNSDQEGHTFEPSVRKGMNQQTRDQERVMAEHAAKAEILAMMNGVSKTFYFIVAAWSERNGEKDWGIARRDGTVRPNYSALATLLRRVGDAALEGRVDLADSSKAGYLFANPDGTQTLVVWTKSKLDTQKGVVDAKDDLSGTVVLKTHPGKTHRVTDAVGFAKTLTANDKGELVVPICRFATYVEGLSGLMPCERPIPSGKIERHAFPETKDPTIVVRTDLNPDDFVLNSTKSMVDMARQRGRMKVHVWNLSPQTKKGVLKTCGGVFHGLPQEEIELPPMGERSYDVELEMKAGQVTQLGIGGVFNGRKLTRFVMQAAYRDLDLANTDALEPDLSDLSKWRANDSADERKISWDAAEKAVRIDVRWTGARPHWFYEIFEIAPKEKPVKEIVALEFDVRMTQDKVENDVDHSYVMTKKANGEVVFVALETPTEEWKHRTVLVPYGAACDVVGLQFGCNPRGSRCSYWVRNLVIRTAREKQQEGTNRK